jgi:protein disulfide-isomerase A6
MKKVLYELPVAQNKGSSTLALLLTKDSKVPLLWKVLGNRYPGTSLRFGAHSDKDGKAFEELFVSRDDHGVGSKVLLWVEGNDGPRRYTGVTKFEPLISFFEKMMEGTGDVESLLVDQEEKQKHSVEDL